MYSTKRASTGNQASPKTPRKTVKVEKALKGEPKEIDGMVNMMKGDGVKHGHPFEKVYNVKVEDEKPTTMSEADKKYYFPELREHIDKRVVEARIDTMENRYDREIRKTQETIEAQSLVMELLLERIKDIERQLPALKRPYYRTRFAVSEPATVFSSKYVQEKASQTPSDKHSAEGVYVTVSRSNGARVQRVKKTATPRIYHYGYPDYTEFYDDEKVTRVSDAPLLARAGLRTSSSVRPTKTIEFFPPIPGWNTKRRPRNT